MHVTFDLIEAKIFFSSTFTVYTIVATFHTGIGRKYQIIFIDLLRVILLPL